MNSFRTEDLNGSLHWVCGYAGRRINSHLFIRYKQQFHLTDFFRTFVRNLNFNKFNWAEGWAGLSLNSSTAASPNVSAMDSRPANFELTTRNDNQKT